MNEMSQMLFLDKLIHKKNYEEIQERVARSCARGYACDQFLFQCDPRVCA